jgi:hypothetical protein
MTTVARRGDWLAAKVGDDLVMMSVESGSYLGLTEVGARIWELIETPADVETLVQRLQTEYAVEAETCRAEVDAFLAELARHGAATITPA